MVAMGRATPRIALQTVRQTWVTQMPTGAMGESRPHPGPLGVKETLAKFLASKPERCHLGCATGRAAVFYGPALFLASSDLLGHLMNPVTPDFPGSTSQKDPCDHQETRSPGL